MGLTDRVQVCVADTPEAFAEAVVQVHETESIWTELSDAGVALARARFSLGAASARLGALLRDLGLPADEG
jgi:glycosyltransferase involved in cell wall biosynthesis